MGFALPILLFVSLLAIIADVFLFAGILNRFTSILSLIIAGSLTYFVLPTQEDEPKHDSELGVSLLFALSSLAFFKILLMHPITIAVRTPWTALPRELFICFGLMVFCALLPSARSLARSVMTFAYLGLTALAFPLGYGFDSFLHRAAEVSVATHGLIHPAPILYGGQYSLVVALHHLTNASIDSLDRFLVPLIAALVLPAILRRNWTVIFLLPLSLLTITTPFAFATLLFLAVVLLCTHESRTERLRVALPIAIAAACVHLVAGIPALVVVALSLLKHPKHLAFGAFGGALLVPLALIAKLKMSGAPIHFHLPSIPFSFPNFITTFRPFEDFAYAIGVVIVLLFGFFLALGLREQTKNTTLDHLLAAALAFAVSGFSLTALNLPEVINYEQCDYARRLLLLAVLALTPFVVLGYQKLAERIAKRGLALVCAGLAAMLLIAVGHFYLLYPRADRHITSKGFNVAAADFTAAKTVRADAASKPYFILAPQTTSAAFVREFGFPPDAITYPIPTGGELYQFFLAMTEGEAKPQTIAGAMMFTDRKLGYFILPKYWWRYDEIKQKTDAFATGSWDVGNEITVWKFERK